ncbi:hypothetical protein MRB53_004389 [Persea americana]|uniref:Uncharacterized protein n=2 Tax=Persea americana TaxID=3435 RepID=A0ACC2MA30_PERAE|nr:hypothetical protein MRB53_004382 [Persea americana]KAJ8642641.1 hypothetical protein MRB53_004389 [Persea americana]
MQPILVFMYKVDGSFKFSPVGVNFLTEVARFSLRSTCFCYRLGIKRLGKNHFFQFVHLCRYEILIKGK